MKIDFDALPLIHNGQGYVQQQWTKCSERIAGPVLFNEFKNTPAVRRCDVAIGQRIGPVMYSSYQMCQYRHTALKALYCNANSIYYAK